MRYDAVLERRPADSVRNELKAMEEAADRSRKEEAKQRRERERAEKKARKGGATPPQQATV